MYFPLLRGRQNELLAIRELVDKDLLSNQVCPIIEPIKITTSFLKLLEGIVRKEKDIAVICNSPLIKVEEEEKFLRTMENHKELADRWKNAIESKCIIPALHIEETINSKKTLSMLLNKKSRRMYLLSKPDDLRLLNSEQNEENDYFVMPDEAVFRRKIRSSCSRILIADNFNKKSRNSQYEDNLDEFFSEEHSYFKEDGYTGFSDYSIIGSEYVEGGFAPRAVAIHIVYFDDNNILKVRHFVSDSNDDIRDPGGKFDEAVQKLKKWYEKEYKSLQFSIPTEGLKRFIELANNREYQGLGVVKKLSIMHHLELMGRWLEINER